MNLKELKTIVFKSSSNLMKTEGEKAFKEGLIDHIKGKKIEGKKIDSTYHIYGVVHNKTKSETFNTHIKIDLSRKKLEGMSCTCEDFKEFSAKGYNFMCSHLTGTACKFFYILTKNKQNEKQEVKKSNSNKKSINNTVKLIRKTSGENIFYELWQGIGSKKTKVNSSDLRNILEGLKGTNIKFKYDDFEFTTSIYNRDLPLTFTLKEREGNFVLTTHKEFPISLNSKNDAFLYKWQIYLPSKSQVEKYLPLYEKLKSKGEIVYDKHIYEYSNLIALLNSISNDINISEKIKKFSANFLKSEFYIYKIEDKIYCDVNLIYGNKKINILNPDKYKALRDYKMEEKILMEIEKCSFIPKEDKFIFIGGDEELFDILTERGESIHSIGKVIFGTGFENSLIYNNSFIESKLQEKQGYYELSYYINNVEDFEFKSMFTAYKSNKRFYKTNDNGFLDFEDEGIKSFFDLIDVLSIDNIEDGLVKIEKSKALYLNENIKNKGINFIKGSEILKNIEDKINYINNTNIKVPSNLKGELRKYQVNGFKWFKALSSLGLGGILADEMGLGKTIQTLTFLLSEENKKSIIIAPTSLIYNWKGELDKFTPSLKVGIIHGEKSKRIKIINNLRDYNVVLTTYGTLRMDINKYENTVFDYCIIDEAQNIKNSLAENTKTVKNIKSSIRFALTGTPIENNLKELWSIFDFIMPGFLYSKEVFEEKFINNKDENLEALKLLIKPFILRRTKKEVMKELPDKIERKFLVEMTPAQKSIYNSYIKAVRDKLNSNLDEKIAIFSYLTRLRQICLDPSIIIEDYKGGSGKIKVAMDLIKNHIETNGKVLLFSQFTSVLKNIANNLDKKGIKYFTLDGTTKSKERINRVNKFNNSEDIKVFLISLKAGGTGLNLTSANLVIHFDPWWNPAAENQATDRAHRIGQKNTVEVVKLVAKGTIEEKIILLQQEKKDLIDSIITGELKNSNLINKLSKEELIQIFNRD